MTARPDPMVAPRPVAWLCVPAMVLMPASYPLPLPPIGGRVLCIRVMETWLEGVRPFVPQYPDVEPFAEVGSREVPCADLGVYGYGMPVQVFGRRRWHVAGLIADLVESYTRHLAGDLRWAVCCDAAQAPIAVAIRGGRVVALVCVQESSPGLLHAPVALDELTAAPPRGG